MQYPNSIPELEAELKNAPATEVTEIAREIIFNAKIFDLSLTDNLQTYPEYKVNGKLIDRNYANPPEYTHDSVLSAAGTDDKDSPLSSDEAWNEGRRACNTGTKYELDAKNLPVNPYLNTGLRGRGLLWFYGPNHAVDNGLLTIKDSNGEPTLYTIGINRQDSPDNAAFAGGFVKFTKTPNGYVYDKEAVLQSHVEEFFEEMISGSVELKPEYRNNVDDEFNAHIAHHIRKRNTPLDSDKLTRLQREVTAAVKMRQVRECDPGFFPRLRDVFSQAKQCYAGPVLNAGRSTNQAWIETRLSWTILSDEKWNYIKGEKPVFNYKFAAGDDAADVKFFRMDDRLLENANESHKAMFAFMFASYLLDSQKNGEKIAPSIVSQAQSAAAYLHRRVACVKAPRLHCN